MRRMLGLALTAVVLLAAPLSAQVVEYYHLDVLGSVRAVTDQSGAVVARYDYLPFGDECLAPPCTPLENTNTRKFTAKERDTETGFDYFGARYYSAGIGRFTSVAPAMTIQANLVDPQRWNRYAYALNNPYRYVDPDGRVIFDYQAFKGYVSEVANFGQDGYGYLVPSVAAVAAVGSVAGDVLLAVGVGEILQRGSAAALRRRLWRELGSD